MVGKSLIFLDKIFNVHSFRKNVVRTDIVQCQTLTSQSSSRLSSKFLQAWQVRARKFFSRVQRNCQKCGLAVTAKAQIFGMLNSQYLLFFFCTGFTYNRIYSLLNKFSSYRQLYCSLSLLILKCVKCLQDIFFIH